MRKTWTVGVIVLLLGLAGCGKSKSDDKESSSGGSTPVSLAGTVNNHGSKDLSGKGSTASVEVEQDDFYFGPTLIKAAPSQVLTVELKNEGKASHTFTIDSLSIDEQLAAGTSKTVTVKLPASSSGPVTFYCRFHKGSGMQGAIYFTAGASGGSSSSSDSGY